MARLRFKCSCGDTFVLARTDRGEWESFERWDASLGAWMNDHEAHGSLEIEMEER